MLDMTRIKTEVLLIVQSNYHALLLKNEISSRLDNISLTVVHTLYDGLIFLKSNNVRSIIVDVDKFSDAELINLKVVHLDEPDIAIIALTADNSEEFAKKIFSHGVDELLIKDSSFHVIVPRLLDAALNKKEKENMLGQSKTKREKNIQFDQICTTASTLSHEINNPLMTILGITELVLDEPYKYDRELLKKLKIIKKSALRIQKSTQNLSNLSKPVFKRTISGKMVDIEKSEINKNQTVKSA